jgi:hypothetical protein
MEKKYFGSKFYSSTLNTILLLVLIILMIIALRFMYKNQETYLPNSKDNNALVTIDKTMPPVENKGQILGNKDDLIAFSIAPNTKVHGIISYRGIVKGGYFFEANILINVLDSNRKVLLKSNATAKDDWMTAGPVNFEGNIDFTNLKKGGAYIEIHNDNASGLPENDKSILIPIIIE